MNRPAVRKLLANKYSPSLLNEIKCIWGKFIRGYNSQNHKEPRCGFDTNPYFSASEMSCGFGETDALFGHLPSFRIRNLQN